jgi:TonB family protein
MTWWHYLLLVNFYLILFFGFYALLLRKETFFQLNRVYLVAASLLSFLIPLIQANWVTNLFITQQVQRTVYSGTLNIMDLAPVIISADKSSGITLGEIVNAIYIAVTLFLVLRLAWQLLILKKTMDQPSPSAAYSFFKKISLGENVSQSSVIAEHEAVHVNQWHSVDVMIIETVMIINWFNPVVYLYRFAIKYIHEFIADRRVIERGTDKIDYAMLLLSQTFDTDTHNLVTPFYNHSLLKERIKMLQKNKSHHVMLAKYGLSAPLFILMMILSSATVKNSKAIKAINSKTETALQMPATNVVDVITDNGQIPAENKADTIPDKVFSQVERVPEFPGGLQAFGKFLAVNIKYPAADKANKVQGKVYATFIVERDGSLSGIKALRGPSATLEQAAVAALLRSPKWKPGYQNGKAVRVSYTVPVSFTLPGGSTAPESSKPHPEPSANGVYSQVEVMPMFPGGLDAFLKFLGNNVKYPKEDREKGISGKVYSTFVVETDGTLSDIKASRGPSAAMMAEAVRVLKLSPKWTPGANAGKPVRVSFTVPLNFALEPSNGGNALGILDSLRKKTNIKGHHVLYIVDDVEYKNGNPLPNIKQEDIASMEVLKDETAVKIYGERGREGVIIITTTKNKKK